MTNESNVENSRKAKIVLKYHTETKNYRRAKPVLRLPEEINKQYKKLLYEKNKGCSRVKDMYVAGNVRDREIAKVCSKFLYHSNKLLANYYDRNNAVLSKETELARKNGKWVEVPKHLIINRPKQELNFIPVYVDPSIVDLERTILPVKPTPRIYSCFLGGENLTIQSNKRRKKGIRYMSVGLTSDQISTFKKVIEKMPGSETLVNAKNMRNVGDIDLAIEYLKKLRQEKGK